jgi:hypothetical protein
MLSAQNGIRNEKRRWRRRSARRRLPLHHSCDAGRVVPNNAMFELKEGGGTGYLVFKKGLDRARKGFEQRGLPLAHARALSQQHDRPHAELPH